MFEILFLGTSASAPSARRGLSASIVQHNEYRFLIDCGEGTQRQILQSGLGFKHLTRILLTHHHLDHILGLGGLMSTFLRWEAIEQLEVFGGKTALERVKKLVFDVVLAGRKPPMPLYFREIVPGIIFEADDFTISAIPVTHRGTDCFGYIFEEKARRPFLNDKATALGVPFGPERRLLVEGQSITLADGKIISPEDVLGALERGTKLVVIGDTGRTDNLLEFVRDADGLVIESTYLEEDVEMARQFSHLTANDAAELGRKAGVKQLLLTHISRRYREKDVVTAAQAIFPTAQVARDFDAFIIKREG
ncbi:MAG: ribonuclease [Anaerolineae bacterium CG_4_9_14_3_um_filter_57_17]|nr:ribonuclease Z [bacterium]NCT21334.1 ribonuclease Z [bacterium]OIO83682.1 MAG: ribonuclease Z [Anaerolineae bacterium CG2_30_57_67]PJB65160.1 MAG: ribonuclease [Anaerolineae bacterium CG_4_9_14_3_um_filter_57_17]